MPKQATSEHLRPEEEELIKELLGDRKCMSMGIAELAISPIQNILNQETTQSFEWQSIIRPGLCCFVTDPERNNDYFIQVFNMDKSLRIWEQRMEIKMQYKRRRRHLITFDGAYGMVCLNFIDDDEADVFARAMSSIMQNKANKVLGDIPTMLGDDLNSSPARSPSPVLKTTTLKPDKNGKNKKDKGKKTKDKRTSKPGFWGKMFGSDKCPDPADVFSQENIKNQIGKEEFEKLKIFLQVACLDVSILDDPERGPEIYKFYKDQIFGKTEIEAGREDEYGQVDLDMYDGVELSDDEAFNSATKSKNPSVLVAPPKDGDIFDAEYEEPDDIFDKTYYDADETEGDIFDKTYYEADETEDDIFDQTYYDDGSPIDPLPLPPKNLASTPKIGPKPLANKGVWPPPKVQENGLPPPSKLQKQAVQTKTSPPPPPKLQAQTDQPKPQGGPKGAPPPPPPPPGLPSVPKPSSIGVAKAGAPAVPKSNAKPSGNTREDLMDAIKGGAGVLKKPKIVKDATKLGTNCLSDILGGALAKIKEVNIVYGDVDLDASDSWDEDDKF